MNFLDSAPVKQTCVLQTGLTWSGESVSSTSVDSYKKIFCVIKILKTLSVHSSYDNSFTCPKHVHKQSSQDTLLM